MSHTADQLVRAAKTLADALARIKFVAPVAVVYHPLRYAWTVHEAYLRSFGGNPKRVLFLGMNPGPFGMVQTGVPFGEVAAVRDWLGLTGPIVPPPRTHARRPILGFACPRSEVSGRRLWGLFARRFGTPEIFFAEHFVANYCPLAFLDAEGRNLTPDKFAAGQTSRLFAVCDEHLRQVVASLRPEWLIGVGDFAEKRARLALADRRINFGRICHPSPANPAANRDWPGTVTRQMQALGIWTDSGEGE